MFVGIERIISIDHGVLFAFEKRDGWRRLKERCARRDRINVRAHRLLLTGHVVVMVGEKSLIGHLTNWQCVRLVFARRGNARAARRRGHLRRFTEQM